MKKPPKKPKRPKSPELTIPLYQAPRSTRRKTRKKGDVRILMPGQDILYQEIKDKRLRQILCPTGYGKSTIMRACAIHDMESGHKVVIAVPQTVIADSFHKLEHGIMVDGKKHPWVPDTRIGNGIRDATQRLTSLIKSKAAELPLPMIVSHQTLVSTFKHLRANGDPAKALKNVSVFIDEVHHSQNPDKKSPDEIASNRLGDVVRLLCEKKALGPLTIATATYMRSDGIIVPDEFTDQFVGTRVTLDEHMRDVVPDIKTVSIRYVYGPQKATYETLIAEEPNARTFTYLPLSEKDKKWNHASMCKAVIKKHGIANRDIIDFVEDNERVRKETYAEMRERIKGDDNPTHLLALGTWKEGADWPAASRSIMLSPTYNLREFIQILGRLLRSYEGKNKVELCMIIPSKKGKKPDPEEAKAYMNIFMASLYLEQLFRPRPFKIAKNPKGVRTPDPIAKVAHDLLLDPDVMQKLHEDMINIAVKSGGDKERELQVYVDATEAIAADPKQQHKLEGKDPVDVAIQMKKEKQRAIRKSSSKKFSQFAKSVGADVPDSVKQMIDEGSLMGICHAISYAFDHKGLKGIREALGEVKDSDGGKQQIRNFYTEHGRLPPRDHELYQRLANYCRTDSAFRDWAVNVGYGSDGKRDSSLQSVLEYMKDNKTTPPKGHPLYGRLKQFCDKNSRQYNQSIDRLARSLEYGSLFSPSKRTSKIVTECAEHPEYEFAPGSASFRGAQLPFEGIHTVCGNPVAVRMTGLRAGEKPGCVPCGVVNRQLARTQTKPSSGYFGVIANGLRWTAKLSTAGYLGLYVKKTDAARAYDAAVMKHLGPRGRRNLPNETPGPCLCKDCRSN